MLGKLLVVSVSTWIFWMALFALRHRVEQMYSAGFGSGDRSFLKIVTVMNGLALISLLAFIFAYGTSVSWLDSLIIVVGGYLISFLFLVLLRVTGLNHSFINVLAKIGVLAMPICAITLWVIAWKKL